MPVNTVIDRERNLIIHSITETMSLSVIIETISKTLNDPDYQAGMDAIWHFIDVSEVDLSSEDLMYAAEFSRKNIDKEGKAYKLALVAAEDLPFGLTRAYEAWCNERPVSINNFRVLDDALKWINQEHVA